MFNRFRIFFIGSGLITGLFIIWKFSHKKTPNLLYPDPISKVQIHEHPNVNDIKTESYLVNSVQMDTNNSNENTPSEKQPTIMSLPRTSEDPNQQSKYLYNSILIVILGITGFYLLSSWYVWFRQDPDFLGYTANIAQLLSLLSLIGLETSKGQSIAQELFSSIQQSAIWRSPKNRTLFSFAILVLVLTFYYLFSPFVAAPFYNFLGENARNSGQNSKSATFFQQAVSLAPQNVKFHLNLAEAYENLFDFTNAIREYQIVISLDDKSISAYNNLANLQLSAGQEPELVINSLAVKLLQNPDLPILIQAVLLKNLGWAYLKGNKPRVALLKLNFAKKYLETIEEGKDKTAWDIKTLKHLFEISRLIIQTYEILNQPDQASKELETIQSFALSVRSTPIENLRCKNISECDQDIIWAKALANELLDMSQNSDFANEGK